MIGGTLQAISAIRDRRHPDLSRGETRLPVAR
jgi:hypothetical protein